MKHFLTIILIFSMVALTQSCGSTKKIKVPAGTHQIGAIYFQDGSFDEVLRKAKEQNKPIFVDFYAIWCGPCKTMEKDEFGNEELGKVLNDNFLSYKLDGETAEGKAVAISNDLKFYPTLLFFSPDGKVLAKESGYVTANAISSTAKEVLYKLGT